MTDVRINLRTLINKSAIRTEKRGGRDVLVIPSATLPDDIVMNGVLYPKDVIANCYHTLDRTPAPIGHPKTADGMFLSSRDPEAIIGNFVGAWNENVRQEGGRVLLDKVVDIEYAKQTDKGRELLNAVDKGEPIHTSTGLIASVEDDDSGRAKRKVTSMILDHDAILLNEPGAATPEQGVGMLVNGKQVEVINSDLTPADREIEWAGESLVRAIRQKQDASAWDKIRDKVLQAIGIEPEREPETEEDEDMDKEAMDKLVANVSELQNAITAINEKIGGIEETVNSLKAANESAAAAEKTEAEAKAVEQGLMNEEDAKATPLSVLKNLLAAAKAQTPPAAAPFGAPLLNSNKDTKAYAFPSDEE